MAPQEKAEELVRKYVDLFKKSDTCFGDCNNTVTCQQSWYQCDEWYRHAKECALVSVNEIMHVIDWHEFETPNEELNYWNEVKQEIKVMKVKEHNSLIIQELLNEVTPDEMKATERQMELIAFSFFILNHYGIKEDDGYHYVNSMGEHTTVHKLIQHYLEDEK
jgi:hypothetical protein